VSITRGTFHCYVGESLQEFTNGFAGDVVEFTGGKDAIELGTENSASRQPGTLGNKIVRIEPETGVQNGHIQIGPTRNSLRAYRGKIRLILEGKSILVVNEIPLEDYLLGAVPAEMDPTWPKDALKAQAVASRTYALFQMGRYNNRGFDLADDARSQLYGGVEVETEASTSAAIETTNEVVAYEGKLACVVFHAESGGQTASNLDVWPRSGAIPYLAGVSDIFGVVDFSKGGKYEQWSSKAAFDELKAALNRDGETYVGNYLSAVTILGRSENGRAQSVDLLGEKNPIVNAMVVSRVLDRYLREDFLPSNNFHIAFEGDGYRFIGSGKGHGVGMSQWGAHERALNDEGYQFILAQYFPGTDLMEIPLEGIQVVHNTAIDLIR
jgi:stage II sporulation protein D